jgi:hypothetical protein
MYLVNVMATRLWCAVSAVSLRPPDRLEQQLVPADSTAQATSADLWWH